MATFKLAASGDTILLQPFPQDYDGWKEIASFFGQADGVIHGILKYTQIKAMLLL